MQKVQRFAFVCLFYFLIRLSLSLGEKIRTVSSNCPEKWSFRIVLPENWTGGLDGESEETIIPSGAIDETTT